MEDKAKDLTTFTSHPGLYRFNRIPFGLKNAPRTIQRTVGIIRASARWLYGIVHLDDIIIFIKTIEEHFEHPTSILSMLKAVVLSIKFKNCFLFQDNVDYLGHVVSPGKLQIAANSGEAIMQQIPPSSLTQFRSFPSPCSRIQALR